MHLDGRLNAFARTQTLLTRDPEAGVDLEYLVAEELQAYRSRDDGKIVIDGPTVRLAPKAAESFGLAIHELATNAIKYGALSSPDGRIDVSWRFARDGGEPEINFAWREKDGPRLDGEPIRRGFGTELLERTLAFDLQAKTVLEFGLEGLTCTIKLPMTDSVLHKGSVP